MNKCNFCAYSIPTGQMDAWICEYKEFDERASYCEKVIKTMMEYNKIRANNNINKMTEEVKE